METSQQKLARLLAAARLVVNTPAPPITQEAGNVEHGTTGHATSTGRNGESITLNTNQLYAVTTLGSGSSGIIIGAAGTGKTTCTREVISELIQSNHAGLLQGNGHKHLPQEGTPGIVCVSFTRRAVANIRKAMPDDMKANCITIHALLEYQPVYYSIVDPGTGEEKNTMRFEPTRHALNPLPSSIRVVIIDESSMVSVELYEQIKSAVSEDTQFIFLGDIQQLPPVFGSAILGFKMLELPTIELTEVYRQALESPIIKLAHRILSGVPIPSTEFIEWKIPGKLTIHPWKKKLSSEDAVTILSSFLTAAIDSGSYDPMEDMILMPFNKSCGTIEINRHIANHLARKRGAITHEIVAGFNKHYLSEGDKVLYDKEDAIITSIVLNGSYTGAGFQKGSQTLDYWGFDGGGRTKASTHTLEETDDALEFLLSQSVALGEESKEDRIRQASHIITLRMADTDMEVVLDTAAEINSLLMAYALTVHKSQGSEFRKVFLLLHQSHATMLQRELLYTAVTRAKEELYIICEPESFIKGITNQRIKGNTLAEKAIYFQGLQKRSPVLN